jgi:PAS domain S-box-containing protein
MTNPQHSEKNTDRAFQALKESEQLYKAVLRTSPDAIQVTDLKGKIIEVSEKSLKLTGAKSPDELIGRSAFDFIAPEDKEMAMANLLKTLKEGELKPSEINLFKLDGTKYIGELSASVIKDSQGKPLAFLGVIRDITERMKFEESIKESEEKYHSLFARAADSIILIDTETGQVVDFNRQMHENLGYTQEEFKKLSIPDFDLMEGDEEYTKHIEKILRDGSDIFETKYITKNGSIRNIRVNARAIKIKGKDYLHSILHDFTDQKESEEKIRESEEKYRNLFEKTPVSILLLDNDGVIADCNPASEKLTMYKREELIGKKFHKLGKYQDDFFPTVLKRLKRYLDAGKLPPLEIEIHRKDRSTIWAQMHASLVKFGETSFIQIIVFNISNRKKAEQIVEEEVKKLKELERIRKDLISRVSHELKTPIMSISGASELLTDTYKDQIGKDATDLVKMIERGGNRLKILVERLLDISRIDYDRLELKLRLEDIGELVKECSEDLLPLLKEREITLNLDIVEKVYIKMDRIRIEQVINNLLSNARKNTPPDGKISVTLKKDENWAVITINDTGVGLTEEEIDILFTRFGKIERQGDGLEFLNIQGSGLGLYIAKRILDLHGGKIFAQSEGRNKGSTFIVKLPI